MDCVNGIRKGHNTYKVHFVKIGDGTGDISISFKQYQDIIETDTSYLWALDKKKNHIDNDSVLYKEIFHFTKEDAPIIVATELTDVTMNMREDIVTLGKDVNDLYNTLKDYRNIVTYAWYGLEVGGILGAAVGIGVAIVDNRFGLTANVRTAIISYLSKTYSAEKYKENLINNSGYHTTDMFVEDMNMSFAMCDYGLRLSIKDNDAIYNIFDPSPKECSRWDSEIAYGQLGCVGEWESEEKNEN